MAKTSLSQINSHKKIQSLRVLKQATRHIKSVNLVNLCLITYSLITKLVRLVRQSSEAAFSHGAYVMGPNRSGFRECFAMVREIERE